MENEVLQENAVEEKVEQTAQEEVVAKKPVKVEKSTVKVDNRQERKQSNKKFDKKK